MVSRIFTCRLFRRLQWGFIGERPGATLALKVDSTTAAVQKDLATAPHTVITINYLRSYEHMGKAGAPAQPSFTLPARQQQSIGDTKF